MSDEIQISTLVDGELRRRFDVERAVRGVNVKKAVSEALELWISEKRNLEAIRAKKLSDSVPSVQIGATLTPSPEKPGDKTLQNSADSVQYPTPVQNSDEPGRSARWEFGYLNDILESKHYVATEAIQHNLIAFRELATGEEGNELPSGDSPPKGPLSDNDLARIRREAEATRRVNQRAEAHLSKHPARKKRRPEAPAGTDRRR